MAKEFVKGWNILNTLGEGAYGEVKLLENVETNEAVAVKMINLAKYPNAVRNTKIEIVLHRMLAHENIIKFYGHRQESDIQYIFLEYANGGELFDKIEPDIGMDIADAHRYFCQIMSGVQYIHSRGIVHRDLKPENLLLDNNDNIKISDFGMASMFRNAKGHVRTLDEKCGSHHYMAPEVYTANSSKPYAAEPVDIWSCGVIMFALLSGELPWDAPNCNCDGYRDWKESKFDPNWMRIDCLAFSLIRKILMPNVSQRYTLEQIKNHHWFKKSFNKNESNVRTLSPTLGLSPKPKRPRIGFGDGENKLSFASQPANCHQSSNLQLTSHCEDVKRISFSQPARPENMFLSTQMPLTPVKNTHQNVYQRLVRRMTRFMTNTDAKTATYKLVELFEKKNYQIKLIGSGQIKISTIDKSRSPLVFMASIIEMNSQQILVDFRLSRGNGIEFKRHFVSIRQDLSEIIAKGPISWPLAFATNSLP